MFKYSYFQSDADNMKYKYIPNHRYKYIILWKCSKTYSIYHYFMI